METDEDIMIRHLEHHRDIISMACEIGKAHGIPVKRTHRNNSNGDFEFPSDRVTDLIAALDLYIGTNKAKGSK